MSCFPSLPPTTWLGDRDQINVTDRVTFTPRERADKKCAEEQLGKRGDVINSLGKLWPHSQRLDMCTAGPLAHLQMLPESQPNRGQAARMCQCP